MKTIQIAVSLLVEDLDLYPRNKVDRTHVGHIVEAMKSDAEIPPIVIDRKTKTILDGVHRVRAKKFYLGDNAKIEAEVVACRNRQEMFKVAMERNSTHGVNLDPHDRNRCVQVARELGITDEDVAACLNMTVDTILAMVETRTATRNVTVQKKGKSVTIKRVIPLKKGVSKFLAGKTITRDQEEANERIMGVNPTFIVNNVIDVLKFNMIDPENENFVDRLRTLQTEIRGWLKRHKL